MKQEALSQFPMWQLPVLGMFLFFAAWLIIVWITYRRSNKGYFEKMARLALEKDGHDE